MNTNSARLVDSPVFILSSIRSGSTLLRCLLDTHPQIHAPHELHLLDVGVDVDEQFAALSMRVAGLDQRELEHLLWDRVLHHELKRSGKDLIVEKTPSNLLRWRRVTECWPNARYLFLLRHPVHIVDSAVAGRPQAAPVESADLVRLFLTRMVEARQALPGLTVRYEELTADPATVTKGICVYLGLPWDPGMLAYGRRDHGPYLQGIGDFGDRIRSGRVQPGRPLPVTAEVPADWRGPLPDAGLRLGRRPGLTNGARPPAFTCSSDRGGHFEVADGQCAGQCRRRRLGQQVPGAIDPLVRDDRGPAVVADHIPFVLAERDDRGADVLGDRRGAALILLGGDLAGLVPLAQRGDVAAGDLLGDSTLTTAEPTMTHPTDTAAITMPADNHIHTEWSWDAATGRMLESCERAVQIGLPAIAFTDHADFTDWAFPGNGRTDTPVTRVIDTHATSGLLDIDGYLSCLDKCRTLYPGLRILSGVELGESHIFAREAAQLIAHTGGLDRVLGSLHSLPSNGQLQYAPHLMKLDPGNAPAIMRTYLAETLQMIETSPVFAILAHLDYPMRAWPKTTASFVVTDYEEEYRGVLQALARSGRALEVNTAGPWPADAIVLQWWNQEGGEAVSFGSDAHAPDEIAKDFPAAAAMVEACGFRPGRDPIDFWRR